MGKTNTSRNSLSKRDLDKLEVALCTIAGYEGDVKDALSELGFSDQVVHQICSALRLIVDGEA